MDGNARFLLPIGNDCVVNVLAKHPLSAIGGKQGWVNVDNGKFPDEFLWQKKQKPGQNDQIDLPVSKFEEQMFRLI